MIFPLMKRLYHLWQWQSVLLYSKAKLQLLKGLFGKDRNELCKSSSFSRVNGCFPKINTDHHQHPDQQLPNTTSTRSKNLHLLHLVKVRYSPMNRRPNAALSIASAQMHSHPKRLELHWRFSAAMRIFSVSVLHPWCPHCSLYLHGGKNNTSSSSGCSFSPHI